MKSAFRSTTRTCTLFRHRLATIWRSLLAILCCVASAMAQNNPPIRESQRDFQHYGTRDGLSNSEVRVILRDSMGFMWFGTSDGLNKFDGYDFTVYKPDRLDTHSIAGNSIDALHESSNGILWIGTSEGRLCSFDRTREVFRNYVVDSSGTGGAFGSGITKIIEDRHGKLWLITMAGRLIHFDPVDGNCTARNATFADFKAVTLSNRLVYDALEDSTGALWLGTSAGLLRYQPATGSTQRFKPPQNSRVEPRYNDAAYRLMKIPNGNIVAVNNVCLFEFDLSSESFTTLLTSDYVTTKNSNQHFTAISYQPDGTYWIGTIGAGLLQFTPRSDELLLHQHHELFPGSLSGNSVRSLSVDDSGMLWCGTRFGIDMLALTSRHITKVGGERAFTQGLRNLVVRSLLHDRRRNIWIGTDAGAYVMRDSDDGTIRARPDVSPLGDTKYPLNALYEDIHGWIWFGYSSPELIVYQPDSRRVKRYSSLSVNSGITFDYVYSFTESSAGELWFGTRRGLVIYDRDADRFEAFRREMQNDNLLYVFDLLELEDGKWWLATNEGIWVFDAKTRSYVHRYEFKIGDSGALSSNEVWCLHRDRQDRIWVCTYGQGINLYDPQSDSFRCFGESEGLPSGATFGMLEDGQGRFWLSTTKGLSRFDPAGGIFRNFDERDGLQSNEFYFGAYHRSRYSGEMFFGGVKGLNRFYPDSIRDNSQPPPLAITGLQVFGHTRRRELVDGDSLRLSYSDNFISLTFAALDYSNPGKQHYAYVLEGVDPDWVYCGTRRYAAYTDLPGGSYTFRVKGSNCDGVWNEEGIAITLIITPPFWNTLLFRAAVVLLLIAGVAGGLRVRIRAIQRKAELRRKMLESELEALRLQMNPHFMFNSLHSIQNFIIKHDQDTAYSYLARFACLMRMTLENSGAKEITLARELQTLKLYLELETLRFEHRIRYVIDVDNSIDVERQLLPPLLLQPYVENAIVHGLQPKYGKGLITVRIRRQAHQIICSVEDDGAGRAFARRAVQKNNARHLSIGMKVARKRLERLNAQFQQSMAVRVTDLYDALGKAAGTRVDITLAATAFHENRDNRESIPA